MDSTCIYAKLDQFDAIIFSLYRMNLTMAMEGTIIKHSRTPPKMDWPAQISMREVMLFPEYQVTDYTLFHLIVSPHPALYQVLNAKLE